MSIFAPSAESVRHRHAGTARVARLHVTSRCEIWRLVAEKESTLRIVPVKHIPHPNFRSPVVPGDAGLEVRQNPRWRAFIVRFVKVEIVETVEIDARVNARVVIFQADVELILRRM